MVERSQHLHPGSGTATPPPVSPSDAWGPAQLSSKLTASYFVNMEECLFRNALPSFGVNKKSSPSRQTAALCGVAEPIPADRTQGRTISLLLKAASFSYLQLPNTVVEQTPTRENRSHQCL